MKGDAECSNCRFWQDSTEAGDSMLWGYCRRDPPRPYIDPESDADGVGVHPWTVADEWCGEWKAKQ